MTTPPNPPLFPPQSTSAFVGLEYEGSRWPTQWTAKPNLSVSRQDFERLALSCFLRDWPEHEARWRLEQALGRTVGRMSA